MLFCNVHNSSPSSVLLYAVATFTTMHSSLQTEYECKKCEGSAGDLRWAENHVYDRKHVAKIISQSGMPANDAMSTLITNITKGGSHYGLSRGE